jgi:hypothetical protein
MKERNTFPANCGGRMYLNLTDYEDDYGPEFGYLVPADYVDGDCQIGDCWVCNRNGDVHEGYNVSPVPFPASALGEEQE